MTIPLQDPAEEVRSFIVRWSSFFYMLGGLLLTIVAIASLVLVAFGQPAVGFQTRAQTLMFLVTGVGYLAVGILLTKRVLAGALLAVVVTLYPLVLALVGSRSLSAFDIIVMPVTIALVVAVWTEFRPLV